MSERARAYARISKTDPGVPKVEEQEARCRALAEAEGYELADGATFADDGISAYRSHKHRPGWSELLAAAQAGEFDVLLFDRQDRLQRDQTATLRFIADCRDAGISWHSVDKGRMDLSDPMQVMMAVYGGGEAEGYSRKISENVARRNASDRDKGVMRAAGVVPFGWQADRHTLDAKESKLVRKGIEMVLAHRPRWDVVTLFNESGQLTRRGQSWWRPSTVYDTLRRGLNASLVEHAGETVGTGTWQPICTEAELKQVRTILATPAQEWAGKPPATLLSGIARCVCGRVMHAHGQQWARVYRCSVHDEFGRVTEGTHTAIKIELLDAKARDAVARVYALAPESSDEPDAEAAELVQLISEQNDIKDKISRLHDMREDGDLSKAEHSVRVAKRTAELDQLQAKITERVRASAHAAMLTEAQTLLVSRPVSVTAASAQSFADDYEALVVELGERFDRLSLDDQRRLVQGAVKIEVRPGRGVGRVWIS